jgi:hypothetical protein
MLNSQKSGAMEKRPTLLGIGYQFGLNFFQTGLKWIHPHPLH